MKVNLQRLLMQCIEEGVSDAINCRQSDWSDDRLKDEINNYIWLQLDYYFDFEDN